jgi:hypothetical protein
VQQTLLYASQKGAHWFKTNRIRLQTFFGVLIIMGFCKMSDRSDYWAHGFGIPIISQAMSRRDFINHMRFLHVSDNHKAPPLGSALFDPTYKVTPIIERLNVTFAAAHEPSQKLCFDESMVGSKARISFKVHIPSKPYPNGIKVFSLCDADNGYLLNFRVYTKRPAHTVDAHALDQTEGGKHVRISSTPYEATGRIITMDRAYTSIELARDLFTRQTMILGTVKTNRKQFPAELKTTHLEKHGSTWLFSPPVLLTAWQDVSRVYVASTCYDPSDTSVTRHDSTGAHEVPCPNSIKQYNLTKAGVDKFDEHQAAYSWHRRSRKWWRALFDWTLNAAITNAWILWSSNAALLATVKSHLEFRKKLALEMVRDSLHAANNHEVPYVAQDLEALFAHHPEEPMVEEPEHWPEAVHGQRHHCTSCSKRTYRRCLACVKWMCISCFKQQHKICKVV